MVLQQDEIFMYQALQLAQKGQYSARPNPMVGALLVEHGHIIKKAFHAQAGMPHAEQALLNEISAPLNEATLYVTLEPCCHTGRTPPCVNEIIAKKIPRVVVATTDPNPLMSGKGITLLKEAGVEVIVGVLRNEAVLQNAGFFKRMQENRPFVRAKAAMSLDAKVAMASGESQWITDVSARQAGHLWRARSGAIVTTAQTVIQDDCLLTVRYPALSKELPEGVCFSQPLKVILDQHLSIPPHAKIFDKNRILLVVGEVVSKHQRDLFYQKLPGGHQVEIVAFPIQAQHLAFDTILQYLSECQINDVFIEAGPTFLTALLQSQTIDELLLYVAPDLLGAQTLSLQNLQLPTLQQRITGSFSDVRKVGRDLELRVALSEWAKTKSHFNQQQEYLCHFIP